MYRSTPRTIIAWLLLSAFSVSVFAQGNGGTGAMLNVTGNVAVNGRPTDRSTAVFSGDQIQTTADSTASISAPGSNAVLGASSKGVFQNKKLVLSSGRTSVSTTAGLQVTTGTLEITPASANAKYDVVRSGCSTSITSREGDLKLSNGAVISSGKSLNVDKICAPGEVQSANNSAPAGAAGTAGAPNSKVIYGAAGAAAAIGTVLAIRTTSADVTPAKPK
jgi:hypothetical protein